IVMPAASDGNLRVAAHEYTHFILHANAPRLPPWLNEGLSEYFAAVRLDTRDRRSAGPVPPRSPVLKSRTWMPLAELVTLPADSPLRDERGSVEMFYAESWALADMLIAAPAYGSRFPALMAALTSGMASDQALASVYGRSLDQLTADLHAW